MIEKKTSNDSFTKKLGGLSLFLGAFAFVFALYAVHGSMAANPLVLPGENELHTIAWVPEAWKFFTRNPQEEILLPLVRTKDDPTFRLATPVGGSPRWGFGLNRAGRGIWMETALLLEGAPATLFHPCEKDPNECLAESTVPPVKLKNRSPNKYLCGDVAIVYQKPVPWVWARDGHPPIMPSRFLRLDVEC